MEDILADRLNNEPPIFRGLGNSELGLLIKVAVAVWLPTCLTIAFLLGKVIMGVGAAMMMVLLTVLIGGSVFQRIKRGRPDFYYQHYMMMRNKVNTKENEVIQYTGQWGIGRE